MLDHQVHFDEQLGHGPKTFDDDRAHAEVRHEMAIHDIDVQPFHAGGFGFRDLLAQPAEIGGEDGG
jgi:hypothetical protein